MNEVEVIKKFEEKLKRFILSKVFDEDVANDLLQEVLIKIYKSYGNLKDHDSLSAWVYQLARNTVMDYFRKHKPNVKITDLPEEISTDDSLNHELVDCLEPFLEQLPNNYREALNLTDLGQLTQKEYAKIKGLSYSGAKSNVQRARLRLRELFDKCCKIESDKYGQVISYDLRNKDGCS